MMSYQNGTGDGSHAVYCQGDNGDVSGALSNLAISTRLKRDNKSQLAATFWDASKVPSLGQKRHDFIEWSDYFMAIAFLSAQRSKDPNTQVGACIVNRENKIVGIGYNGMPNGCIDEIMPWGNDASDELDKKSMYVCHAELNAVLNKNSADVKNCTIYTALFPCNECAKIIIQSGIKEVVYYSDKYRNKDSFLASRRMFDLAGIKHRSHEPKMKRIVIDFDSIESGHKPSS